MVSVRHIVKNNSDNVIDYFLRLAASDVLYATCHRQDCIYLDCCYISSGALVGMRNNSTGPLRGFDPMPQSTTRGYSTTELFVLLHKFSQLFNSWLRLKENKCL